KGTVKFLPFLSIIEITVAVGQDSKEIITKCHDTVNQVLRDHGHSESSLSNCVFCGGAGITSLQICGHIVCGECINKVLQSSSASWTFPIKCPRCKTNISVRDIKRLVSQTTFETACNASAISYLNANRHHGLVLCPSTSCAALIPRSQGYTNC